MDIATDTLFFSCVEAMAARLPASRHKRLAHALALIESDKVFLLPDDTASVTSETDPFTTYHVTDDACECADGYQTRYCKHWIARTILLHYQRAYNL